MMPLPVLVFNVVAFLLNLIIVLFLVFYLLKLRSKAKEMEKKEEKIDTNYHQIVDDALSKERKILDDATAEAGHIINDAKYINTSSKHSVDQALEKMITDIKNETTASATDFRKSYATSLQHLSEGSLHDFQNLSKQLQSDLQQQLKTFHESFLPNMEKELESYKQARLKEAEAKITKIVQEASETIINKSISYEEHQKLMLESLEKAKRDGLFN